MPKKTPPDISPAGQLRWMIEHAGKTRDNLARDLGLENSTVIDAWCDGSILIPFRMIQRIDESLGGEGHSLFFACFLEYQPEMRAAMESMDIELVLDKHMVDVVRAVRRIRTKSRHAPVLHTRNVVVVVPG